MLALRVYMVGRPNKKIPCGAKRKYDGNPCQAKALFNGRCKLHGGMSRVQTTIEGKRNALSNLIICFPLLVPKLCSW